MSAMTMRQRLSRSQDVGMSLPRFMNHCASLRLANAFVDLQNCTQSNYHDVFTEHLHLDWELDWENRVISGTVVHSFKAVIDDLKEICLDSSYLALTSVTEIPAGVPLEYKLLERHPVLGNELKIKLSKTMKAGERVVIKIAYSTTKQCTALGWLEAKQTGSGRHPFLYSQNQAIHCRSLVPLQDTPAIKSTYSASCRSRLPILMSGKRISPPLNEPLDIDSGTVKSYVYDQATPIPSYLIAIAGGELAFASLGDRTGVWVEPAKVEAAVWEFKEDQERYVAAAEGLTSPYLWGRYDVLVLPSSFPYGGMENANLTFLTPALITGDRTEVGVIAHEVCHSWFGNSIGCANWDSFWLNEGWTTYTERLIKREISGEAHRAFEFFVGAKGMRDDLKKQSGHPTYQQLHIPYSLGEDPDEGYSVVPYEKGANFLLHLERTVGGLDDWLPYMKAYVKRFTGYSITTEDWLEHFWVYWNNFPDKAKSLKGVDWDAWLYGSGEDLPVKMEYNTSLADASVELAEKWDSVRESTKFDKFGKIDLERFNSNQISLFLETLATYAPFPKPAIDAMNKWYAIDASGNSEIKLRWYLLTLKGGLFAKEAALWVETAGRMKYCRPIYKAINKVDPHLARQTFLQSGVHFLHPIAQRMVAKELGIELESLHAPMNIDSS